MVAQVVEVEVGRPHGRFVDVIADGRRAGSVEWDHGKWIARPEGCRSSWHADQDAAVADVVESFGRIAARWSRALDRAISDGLDPVAVAGKWGYWFVESGSQPGIGYLVTDNGFRCTCPAGQQGDDVCKHRAAVKFVNGQLAAFGIAPAADVDPEPEPPVPASCPDCAGSTWIDADFGPVRCPACVLPPVLCRVCRGDGTIQHERLDPAPWTCPRCDGSGLDPAAAA